MTASSGALSVEAAVHRGYNQVMAVVFGLTALTFGSEIFGEPDPIDKVDNSLLAVIGLIAVVWYLLGTNRFQRSMVPLGLAVAALGAQILGVVLEMGDPTAFADDIPGMIIFVSFLVLLVVLRRSNDGLLARQPRPSV